MGWLLYQAMSAIYQFTSSAPAYKWEVGLQKLADDNDVALHNAMYACLVICDI